MVSVSAQLSWGKPQWGSWKMLQPRIAIHAYHKGIKDMRFILLSTIIQFLSKQHVWSSLLIGGAKKPHQRSVKKKKEEQDWILKHCDWITKLSVNTEKNKNT